MPDKREQTISAAVEFFTTETGAKVFGSDYQIIGLMADFHLSHEQARISELEAKLAAVEHENAVLKMDVRRLETVLQMRVVTAAALGNETAIELLTGESKEANNDAKR